MSYLRRLITVAAIALVFGVSVIAQPMMTGTASAAEPEADVESLMKSIGVPKEAFSSGLSYKEIVKFVETAISLGQDKAITDPGLWGKIGKGGPNAADEALVGIVRDALNIPVNALPGASAEDLLKGAGTIQAIGGDTSDKNVWDDLGKVNAGNMTPMGFIKNNTTINLPEQTTTNDNNGQNNQTNGGSPQSGDQGSGQTPSNTGNVDRNDRPDTSTGGAGSSGGSSDSGGGDSGSGGTSSSGATGGSTGASGSAGGGASGEPASGAGEPAGGKAGGAAGNGGSSGRTPLINIDEVQISHADQPTPGDSYTAELPNGRGGSDGTEDEDNNDDGNNNENDSDDSNSGDDDSGNEDDSDSDDDSNDDSDGDDSDDAGDDAGGDDAGNEDGSDDTDDSDDTTLPGSDGGGDPREERDRFRAMFPHLAGTMIDPYTKLDALEEYDPDDPCGPKANPGPDGDCGNGGDDGNESDTTNTYHGLTPDCFNEFGCGAPAISDAQAEQIMKLGDPTNPCGPNANPGPDGTCGGEEPEEEPGLPGPSPNCAICNSGQMQSNASIAGTANTMTAMGNRGNIPMGKGSVSGR